MRAERLLAYHRYDNSLINAFELAAAAAAAARASSVSDRHRWVPAITVVLKYLDQLMARSAVTATTTNTEKDVSSCGWVGALRLRGYGKGEQCLCRHRRRSRRYRSGNVRREERGEKHKPLKGVEEPALEVV